MHSQPPAYRRRSHWRLIRAAAGVAAICLSLFSLSVPAQADTVAHYVYNTGGDGLWLHPDSPTVHSAVTTLMDEGAEFDISCWSYGDVVNGDDVWDFGTNPDTGDAGYAADYYIDTQATQGNEAQQLSAQGIPECGSNPQPAGPASTNGWTPNCGGNDYAGEVEVQDFSQGQFEIKVTPTSNARYAELSGYGGEATNEIWHAVQNCVTGLYGTLADGIYEQIRCHIVGGLSGPLDAGGATYDFESWRNPVPWVDAVKSECNWGGWPYAAVGQPYRPDVAANNPTF